mgnify:CR=1 FL=1
MSNNKFERIQKKMNASLPNLELLEFQAKFYLKSSEEFMQKYEKLSIKNNLSLDCTVFKQLWGNTSTAFDITENGEPTFGGQAMTEAYTTVFKECITNTYIVFINNKIAYLVIDATDKFLEDFKNQSLRTVSYARKNY